MALATTHYSSPDQTLSAIRLPGAAAARMWEIHSQLAPFLGTTFLLTGHTHLPPRQSVSTLTSDEARFNNGLWERIHAKNIMTFDKIEKDLSLASWMIQLVIAYITPIVTIGIAMYSLRDTRFDLPDTFFNQFLEYLFVAVIAGGLAFLISVVAKDSYAEGILVWILPATLELAAVVWGLFSDGLVPTLHGLLFSPGPGQGEGSWGIAILTQPAWGCCWYSAMMWWRLHTTLRVAGESRVSEV
jgi:hypothetical protein